MENVSNEVIGKISSLLDKAYALRVNDLKQSTLLANEALKQSKVIRHEALEAKSLNQLSLFLMIQGDYEKSIHLSEEAIALFEKLEDDKGIADAKYNIAGTLYKTNDFNQGLLHLIDCQITYKKYQDHHNLARVQKSMGTIFEFFGDEKNAIRSYQNAMQSGKKADDLNLRSNALNPLSGIYLNRGENDKALEMIEEALRMKEQTGDTRGLAFSLYGRGKVYTQTNEYEKAEADFHESIKIHEAMGEKLGVAMSFHKLGALFFKSGDIDQAKHFLFKALGFAKSHNIVLIIFKANYLLYTLFKKENNNEQALDYLEKFLEAKQIVINDQTSKLIEGYEAISKMQAFEIEAQAQNERLEIIERKNQELDSFFHRVSHDLKGPIASLMSLDAVMRYDVKDKNLLDYMDIGVDNVRRMNHILDELIKVVRIAHEDKEGEKINFEELIDGCIVSSGGTSNFDKITIERNVSQDIEYIAPWSLVNTIIQNLIENGIKYARIDQPNPLVKIDISQNDQEVVIAVVDNGIGMNKEEGNNIFEMFYRAKAQIEGSGLGLYILNRAVEKLKGTVLVDSEIEKGSTFTITLPKS